jgi:glycosyltransferase involved in cell wall biosynthesis
MACAKPLIVCNWAGPAQYVSQQCAILINPSGPAQFVTGLAEAMARLASSAELRETMGEQSHRRVQTSYFDWNAKVARIVEILRQVAKHE